MVKLKGRVSKDYDPDADGGLNYEQPKPGVYDFKIHSIYEDVSGAGNDMAVVVIECIEEGDYEGSRVWDYITDTPESQWKMDQFIYAVGFDPGEAYDLDEDDLEGTLLRVRIKPDSYDGAYRAKVGQYQRHPDSDGPGSGGATVSVSDDDDGDEYDEEDWEPYTEEELKELDLSELKEVAEEWGIELPKGKKSPSYVKAIIEAQDEWLDEDDEEEEEPEEEEEGTDDEWPDEDEIAEMSLQDLRELAEELDIANFAKLKKAKLREKVTEEIDQLSI